MRNIRIVTVGKIKQSAKYLEAGIALYQKRLAPYAAIEWFEVAEESPSATRTVAQVLEKEAQSILKHCGSTDTVVLLNEKGRLLSSIEFSQWFFDENPLNGGRREKHQNRMIFIIGGAFGTSEKLVKKASAVVSLSPLTFPHQMVRLILMEQLYRAYTIAHNEPYHK